MSEWAAELHIGNPRPYQRNGVSNAEYPMQGAQQGCSAQGNRLLLLNNQKRDQEVRYRCMKATFERIVMEKAG